MYSFINTPSEKLSIASELDIKSDETEEFTKPKDLRSSSEVFSTLMKK
jgi:hypothetical protein